MIAVFEGKLLASDSHLLNNTLNLIVHVTYFLVDFIRFFSRQLKPNTDVKVVHHNVDPSIGSEAARKMIYCKHQELDIATLANHYFPYNDPVNRDLRPFFVCQEKLYGHRTTLHPFSALRYVENSMLRNVSRAKKIIQKCLPLLTEKCEKAQIVIEKYIRMTMEMAKHLLENTSNLKIIHLIRDPRAMLDSQARKKDSGAQKISVFNGRAQYMCGQMAKDYSLAKELKKQYPGQIYTLRYENMVDTPVETAKHVFDFLDIPFTDRDKSYVEKYSRPPVVINGSVPLSSWRKYIKPQFLDIVDRYCASLYKEFGYLKFKEYRDIKDPQQIDHIQWPSARL